MSRSALFVFLALALLGIAHCKTYCLLGESGAGKSTTIIHSFDVPGVPAGGHFAVTREVKLYQAGPRALLFLRGSAVFDTQGIHSTDGTSDRIVLQQLLDFYLSHRKVNGTDSIDAFLLLVPATLPRIYIHENLGHYLTAFSPEVLRSIIVVITQNNRLLTPSGPDFIANITAQAQVVVAKHLGRESGVRIPVVMFNTLAPSPAEQADLEAALSSVQPYMLTHLDEPRRAIEAIYQRLLNDSANYDTINVPTVETHTEKVQRQGLKRVVKQFDVVKYEGCRFNVKFPGVAYCHPNKLKTKENLAVDEPYTFEEERQVPVVVDKQEQQLRNEEAFYWQLALEEYERNMSPY